MCLIGVSCVVDAIGQSGLDLKNENDRYYVYASFNGHDDTRMMVETDWPGLVVNTEQFNRMLWDVDFKTVSYDSIRYRHYYPQKVVRGRVPIGDYIYEGNVIVSDSSETIKLPVLGLRSGTNSLPCPIRINLKDQKIELIDRKDLNADKYRRFRLINPGAPLVFEDTLEICDTHGHEGTIKGIFRFSFGCGNPVCLCLQDKKAARFMKKNRFKRSKAIERYTLKKVKAIHAGTCRLGDRALRGVTITLYNGREHLGISAYVGPTMFKNSEFIIDIENEELLYEHKY